MTARSHLGARSDSHAWARIQALATVRLRCDFAWTLAVAVLAVAATAGAFASPAIADALIADGRVAHGQLWRAVTGPLVHATVGHLVRDLALVALAGIAYEGPLRPRRALLFAGGLVLPAVAVLAAGDAQWYCGLSGLSHALLAAALACELVCRKGTARAIVVTLCAVCALKPIFELATGGPAFAMSLGPGVVQVPLAHAVGALVGIACGLTAGLDRRARRGIGAVPVAPSRPCGVRLACSARAAAREPRAVGFRSRAPADA